MFFYSLLLIGLVTSEIELCSETALSLTGFNTDVIEIEYFPGVHTDFELNYTKDCESLNSLLYMYGESPFNCETEIDPRSVFFDYSPRSLLELSIQEIRENAFIFQVKPYTDTKGKFEVSLVLRIVENEVFLTGKYCKESSCQTLCRNPALTTAGTHISYSLDVQMNPKYNESALSFLWLCVIPVLLLIFSIVAFIAHLVKKNKQTYSQTQDRHITYQMATEDYPASPSQSPSPIVLR